MAKLLSTEDLPLLPTTSVEPQARKLALIVVLVSVVVFCVIAPFAKVPLAPVAAFIPIYESALLLNDVITAVILFGHFSILRSRALLVLASGYFFTAAITVPHMLTFPGLFAPSGLIGAGPQSTAWIYAFWHVGFPLVVVAYAYLNGQQRGKGQQSQRLIQRPSIAIVYGIAAALVSALGFTWLATAGHDLLPPILISGRYTFTGSAVLTSTWVFSALAVTVLWRHRSRSLLDLWLLVVMCAWLLDIALSAVLNAGRFDVGFYAGRVYGLLAASYVLIVLLLENNKLYARLAVAHEEALQRTVNLQELNIQNEDRATQYAKALEELHYKDEEIRAVVQHISDCVMTIDARGVVRSANPAVEQIFGYSTVETIGADISLLMPGLRLDSDFFRPANAGHGKTAEAIGEIEGLHKDGRRIPLELAINDFVVHGERLFIGTLRDIRERKLFIDELKQARSYAEQANLAKSTFLANMSHELRTPLNAILGFAQILTSETSPLTAEKKKHFISHILKAGKHLLTLINEVLDLAKVESGTLSLSQEAVALSEVMKTCQDMITTMADQRDIRVVFPADDVLYVFADRLRLQQVLLNLLSNAVKYNRTGGSVTVSCTALPSDYVRITIHDNGQGLDDVQLTRLFQPFNRLGQEAGKEEGSGIGLVVTKRLVELMGGTVGVTSTVGIGSTFWFELQSVAAPNIESEKITRKIAVVKADASASPRVLLYVEDNPTNVALVREILAFRADLRLITAPDAQLGLEMARLYQPAVILLDINLPGMSGNEMMSTLRTGAGTADVPVIALSANAMPHDIAKSMGLGFFCYLTKPIDIDQFFEALDSALAVSTERVADT